ncbi:hypothetical protein T069G_03386 [Trichoderma breve]|uniref:Uncharacterized protein n=1 Tax=Trichoderma breve TaxID=2034170 RepID=A0A9W9E9S4_9HYPO|nr:hypothetical protein T069G_03386 [Trichoderma breve]KAJ4862432.1 hypothetical protein T069G_03386 [Trichoderma breve]
MSPNRQEMRNDALSRIGLPIIPVDPTPQVSEWNDDETTLVTSASLSFSTFSIDDTVVDNDFYPDPLFREELAEFLNHNFGNYREADCREKTVKGVQQVVAAAGCTIGYYLMYVNA